MMDRDTVKWETTLSEPESERASGVSSVEPLTSTSISITNPSLGRRHGPTLRDTGRRSKLDNLPLEILGIIFNFSTVDCVHGRFVGSRDLLQPFTCAAVCPRWYQAALATPSLWTQIGVSEGPGNFRETGSMWKERIAVSLVRSGACPLEIAIQPTYDHIEGDSEAIATYKAILHLLAKHSHRWRTLFVAASSVMISMLRDDATGFLREPTPLLESATLVAFEGELSTDRLLPCAPRLRTVDLDDVSRVFDHCCSPFPSATRLTISVLDADDFLQLMSRFSSLTTLNLRWDGFIIPEYANMTTALHVLLPELTSLVISEPMPTVTSWYKATDSVYIPSEVLSPLLHRLSAPKLCSLTLCADHIHAVQGFLMCHTSAITDLEISSRWGVVPYRRTVPIFASFTKLLRLRFFDLGFPTSFFDELGCVASGIWPRLQRMEFRGIRDLPEPHVLEQFFAMRYSPDKAVRDYPVLDFDFEGHGLPQSCELSIRSILEAETARRAATS